MSIREKFNERVKEETKRERKIKYYLTALIIILLFIASGILFVFKTKETEFFEWISYLCMNLAVGTAITAFFLYFGKAREREYRIKIAKRELGHLIGKVNIEISEMRNGLKTEKEAMFRAFLDRKRVPIDYDILFSEEKNLYDAYELFENHCESLERYILIQANYEKTQDNITNIQFDDEISIGQKERDAIDTLQESCYAIAHMLEIFIGS